MLRRTSGHVGRQLGHVTISRRVANGVVAALLAGVDACARGGVRVLRELVASVRCRLELARLHNATTVENLLAVLLHVGLLRLTICIRIVSAIRCNFASERGVDLGDEGNVAGEREETCAHRTTAYRLSRLIFQVAGGVYQSKLRHSPRRRVCANRGVLRSAEDADNKELGKMNGGVTLEPLGFGGRNTQTRDDVQMGELRN